MAAEAVTIHMRQACREPAVDDVEGEGAAGHVAAADGGEAPRLAEASWAAASHG